MGRLGWVTILGLYALLSTRLLRRKPKKLPNYWSEVAQPLGTEPRIYSLVAYDGKIFGGTSSDGIFPGLGKLYQWNGVDAWVERAPQLGAQTSILGLIVYNNKIYGSTTPNGNLYEWNGVDAWTQVAPQLLGITSLPSLVVYNNKIYGGTNTGRLFEWNGVNAWTSVAPPLLGATTVRALVVYNNKLYGFVQDHLYMWNDVDAWVDVIPSLVGRAIYALAVYNGKLYGAAINEGALYQYDDVGNWILVAPAINGEGIASLAVYNNKLYGGVYSKGTYANGNGHLFVFNDAKGSWDIVASDSKSYWDTRINALLVFNGKLYGSAENFLTGISSPLVRLYEWFTFITTTVTTEQINSSIAVLDSTGVRVSTVRHVSELTPWIA